MSRPAPTNMAQYPIMTYNGEFESGWYPSGADGMNCESLRAYEHGELCPIIHGDILSGPNLLQQHQPTCSFTVIGKLGRGSSSNVWLGKDLTSDRYLALKVLRREDSVRDNSEMRILGKLGKLQVAFFHTNPLNGFGYLCLGSKPLGSSLSGREDKEVPLPNSLRSIIGFMRSLIGIVIDLHNRGICHGDISSGNVALGVHKDAFTPEALNTAFRYERRSYTRFIGPGDPPRLPANLPKYITQSRLPPLLTDGEDQSKADILDFGSAFEGTSKRTVHGTTIFLAPERRKKGGGGLAVSAKTDLWSLGCVLVMGLSCYELFEGDLIDTYSTLDHEEQTIAIYNTLGGNEYLRQHINQCWFVAQIIHSLVQVDPSLRDVNKAMEMVDELERDGSKLDEN